MALASPEVLDALWLSLVTTAISLVVTVVLGLPLAFVLARRRFWGRGLVEAVVDLPIVLPPSVAGLALLLVFSRRRAPVGPVRLPGHHRAIHDRRGHPGHGLRLGTVLHPIRSNRDRGRRSATSRMPPAWTVPPSRSCSGLITVPLAGSALAAGLVMTWARSLGEFGATIMFAGNVQGRTQTLPLVVYSEFQGGDLDASIAAAAILVIAAFGVLVAVRVFHWGRVLDVRGIT